MDSFLEYLVKKKSDGKDVALRIGIILLAVLVSLVVFAIFVSISYLRAFSFFAVLCIGYGAYILLSRMDIEYEYIFTNGELDIDIIRGRRLRKRLTTVKCKDIRIMEKTENVVAKKPSGEKNICAVYNFKMGEIYKIECMDKSGKDKTIFFQPPENLVKEMRKYNPANIKAE